MPDRLVLARARAGEDDAIAELYRNHVGAAMKYARSLCSSAADAEDLVADSFTRVLAQLRAGKGPDSAFRAYLFTTMRHRLYSTNRREFAVDDVAVLEQALPVNDDVETHANNDLLRCAFSTLNGTEQEILLLLDVLEMRPAEVGSRLGLRPSAVSMRASRARSSLAEAFLVAHTQPTGDRQCERYRPNYGRYVRGSLSAAQARQTKAHVDTCETCTAMVAELDTINRGLRTIPAFATLGASKSASGWQFGRHGAQARRGVHGTTSHGGFGLNSLGIVATKVGVTVAAVAVATSRGCPGQPPLEPDARSCSNDASAGDGAGQQRRLAGRPAQRCRHLRAGHQSPLGAATRVELGYGRSRAEPAPCRSDAPTDGAGSNRGNHDAGCSRVGTGHHLGCEFTVVVDSNDISSRGAECDSDAVDGDSPNG